MPDHLLDLNWVEMKKSIVFALAVWSLASLTAQQQVFRTCFEGAPFLIGVDIEVVGTSWYLLAQTEQNCSIDGDIYLIKMNPDGSPVWVRSIGTSRRNTAQRLARLGDGVVVYGRTLQNNTNDCVDDVFAAHFNGDGDLVWEEAFGGADGRDDENPGGLLVVNGTVVLSAYDLLGGTNIQEGYLIQLDESGNLNWSFQYSRTPNDPEIIEHLFAVDDGYITSGRFGRAENTSTALFLQNVATDGTLLWWKYYNIANKINHIHVSSTRLSNNSILLVGQITSGSDQDMLIINTDMNGNTRWARSISGAGAVAATSVLAVENGTFYLAGGTADSSGDGLLCRFTNDGELLWSRSYGDVGTDGFQSMRRLPDGGLLLLGTTTSFGGSGGSLFLVEADADGNVQNSECYVSDVALNIFDETIITTEGGTQSPWGDRADYDFEITAPSFGDCMVQCCPKFDTLTQVICQGDSFEGYSETGIYEDVFTSALGCDSTRVLELTVTETIESTVVETVCQNEAIDGYTETGIYVDTLVSAAGCDSIRTLDLTVLPIAESTLPITLCAGESFEGYSQSGIFIDTLTAATGCDSIRTLELTVLPQSSGQERVTICSGQSFEGYDQTGIYVDTLMTDFGCDSIRTLELQVVDALRTEESVSICSGESYQGLTETGVYVDTLQSSTGCDSIHTINLRVDSAIFVQIDTVICEGRSFQDYDQTGIYLERYQTASGCDSIVTINLTVRSVFVPNAFSPNGDGINDTFRVFSGDEGLEIDSYRIFDRWGSLVYEASGFLVGEVDPWWSGGFRLQPAASGTYLYSLEFVCEGRPVLLTGEVQLMR